MKIFVHNIKDVGIKGMSVLIDILNQDIMDTEITKAVLEALTILFTPEVIRKKKKKKLV